MADVDGPGGANSNASNESRLPGHESRLPAVFRSSAAACYAPGLAGSAFHTRIGWLPGHESLLPVTSVSVLGNGLLFIGVGRVDISYMNRSVTAVSRYSVAACYAPGLAGSAFHTWTISVWYRSGARIDDAVPDQVCPHPR